MFVNKITLDIFLIMVIGARAVCFLIKGLLSVLIGGLITPIQIGLMVSRYAADFANDYNNANNNNKTNES